jgi:anaerobic C4-dicarboxylate transporter
MVNFWGTLLYINVMIMLGASKRRKKQHNFNYTLTTTILQIFILSLLSTELDPYCVRQTTIFHTGMTTQLYLQPV